MALRAGVLARLALVCCVVVFVLHFLSTSLGPRDEYEEDDPNWSERLGLDHYADWEAGVAGHLGNGMDKVRDGLGVIKGGLGWGVTGTKLGSLYEVSPVLLGLVGAVRGLGIPGRPSRQGSC